MCVRRWWGYWVCWGQEGAGGGTDVMFDAE